ncbi:MAG: hypothetical protein GX767_06690 [Firmicutes bacterium]|nr:hypothetical protein [Bacillota bacterium]
MKNRLKISKIAVVFITLALLVSGSLLVSGCIEGANGEQSEEAGSGNPHNEQQEQVQEQENDTGNGLEITDDFHVKNLPEPVNLDELFNAEEAAYRTEQIFDALKSFRLLTEKAEGKISKEEMEALGNTGWETQYLGFHNWTNTVWEPYCARTMKSKSLSLNWLQKNWRPVK